jgi:hypothetical protein
MIKPLVRVVLLLLGVAGVAYFVSTPGTQALAACASGAVLALYDACVVRGWGD